MSRRALLVPLLAALVACTDGGGAVDLPDAAASLDATPLDGGAPLDPDAGEADAGEADAGEVDAGEVDAGEADAGEADAGEADAGEVDAGEGDVDAGAQDAGPAEVVPLYAAAGQGWNDHVRADGVDRLRASGTPCDPAADGPGPDACVHAGVLRSFAVPGQASCAGLAAEDDLGAFEWTCLEGPVRVVSTGLAPGRRLADLLDWTASPVAWRANAVRVRAGGVLVHESVPAVWWSNAVVESAQAGTTTGGAARLTVEGRLAAPATIYAITASSTGSYLLSGAGSALTTGPGVVVTAAGGQFPALNVEGAFTWLEGAASAPDHWGASIGAGTVFGNVVDLTVDGATGGILFFARKTLMRRITVRNARAGAPTDALEIGGAFNVVEDFLADNVALGLRFSGTDSVVRRAVVRAARSNSARFSLNASRNRLVDAHLTGALDGVFFEPTAVGNALVRARVVNAGMSGIRVEGPGNLLHDVEVANVGQNAIILLAPDTRVLGATVLGSRFSSGAHAGSVVTALTSALSGAGQVISLERAVGMRLSAAVALSAQADTGGGFAIDGRTSGVPGLTVDGLASAHHAGAAVFLDQSSGARFEGPLLLGASSAGDCRVNGGTDPGLAVGAMGCAVQGASTAVLTSGISLAASFVGPVTVDDPLAPDDVDGRAPRAAITDWTSSAATHRLWARAGASTTDAAARGRCTGSATCQLWDLGLLGTDTVLRERLPLPTGDDAVEHRWSAASQAACARLPVGATWTGTACVSTFLRGAIEPLEDGAGDDDGLCESGEVCMYLPNLGAYQGDGPLVPAGAFVDGRLTGITLVRRAVNGR